jgi:hypothetical protein
LEWTLPTVPRPVQNGPSKQVLWSSKDQTPVAQDGASTAKEPASESSELFLLDFLNYYVDWLLVQTI